MRQGKRESLGPDDWTEAALEALAGGGVAAVAVEPLAKALGATKGSFYWHFDDRNALLAATLALWERRDTDQVIAGLDASETSLGRLRHLLRLAFTSVSSGSAGSVGTVELALQASSSLPVVAAALERVTRRRVDLITRLYVELGLTRAAARDRALLAYTAYLGHAQLSHSTPTLLPRGRSLKNHIDELVDALTDIRR